MNTYPRRNRLDLNTPEELEITNLIWRIEELGSDINLTKCVTLLSEAKNALSDFIDKE